MTDKFAIAEWFGQPFTRLSVPHRQALAQSAFGVCRRLSMSVSARATAVWEGWWRVFHPGREWATGHHMSESIRGR